MKKYITGLLATCLTALAVLVMSSCSHDDAVDANQLLEVKSVLPTKVMEGQVVTITGMGLDGATSVVFPGNVAVNNINKLSNDYMTVTTPAGIAAGGGAIIVEANGESAEAPMRLTVGDPAPLRVAPLDQPIKINECVEVYGKDLEFMTKAYFPGADGHEVVVNANLFRRKATGVLSIYSPMGVKAGLAQVVLEDCSGKKYSLPEVTLSDEVSGGTEETGGERYVPIWQDDVYIYDWANWQYLSSDQLNLEGIQLREGLMMRLTFDNPDGASVCVCDANWGTPNVDGQGNNTVWVAAGTTELEFPISQGMVETLTAGGGIIIGGGNYTLKKIELFREYPTLWSGEYTTGWWWYLPASELDLSGITPEAGQIIRFTFAHHDAPQTFCLCDGWWGAPYIRDGGESDNNIVLSAGEDFLEFEISEGMAATMNGGSETALIIGGDITITKIQIKTD